MGVLLLFRFSFTNPSRGEGLIKPNPEGFGRENPKNHALFSAGYFRLCLNCFGRARVCVGAQFNAPRFFTVAAFTGPVQVLNFSPKTRCRFTRSAVPLTPGCLTTGPRDRLAAHSARAFIGATAGSARVPPRDTVAASPAGPLRRLRRSTGAALACFLPA